MAQVLTEQQRAFCLEYVKSGNATSSAKQAGYSERTANEQGSQLLRKPLVAAEIARLTAGTQKKSALTAERVIAELSNIAFFDPASMYDDSGKLLNVKDMPEETRRAIAGVEHHLEKGTKLRIASKLGSLELAAKILQLVKQEQTQQQAVQIVISSPKQAVVERVDNAKLLPEWD